MDPIRLRQWSQRVRALPGIVDAEVVVEDGREPVPLPIGRLLPAGAISRPAGSASPGRQAAPSAPRPSISDGGPLAIGPGEPANLPAALERAAARQGFGLLYLTATGETFQSYAELATEARRILAGLRRRGLGAGDRVILQLDLAQDFLPVFWACVLGGLLPVPAAVSPTFREPNAAVNRLRTAWELLGMPMIVAPRRLVAEIPAAPGLAGLGDVRIEAVEELRLEPPADDLHTPGPDEPALLLLTSGSTGTPKAVIQTHRNLVASAHAAVRVHPFSSESRFLNWFPLDHVAGIVMFHLQPLYLSAMQIHGPMEEVLKQPEQWLDWIDRHRVDVTWAPNFAYGQINERAVALQSRRWNLSSLRFILNGGEAIVPRTARRFLRLLAPHGLPPECMHPGWGMSETSGGVVFNQQFRLETTSDDDAFVCLGRPYPGTALRVVDEDGEVLPEPMVGRLQIRGASITPGYWGSPEATATSFTPDGWFDTGDQGFLADGQMTITGRLKETIIINGLNYHGHEIEQVVEECGGLLRSFTAACAVRRPDRDTDELAIFLSPTGDRGLGELVREIRDRVVRGVGLRPSYVVPLPPGSIPKTSIGKIQRSALVRRFDDGEFDTIIAGLEAEAREGASVPDWFFRKVWVPAPAAPGAPAPVSTLLLADAAAAHLGNGLGRGVVRIEPGDAYERLATDRFRVRPGDADDLRRLFAELGEPPARVVHAWCYGAGRAEPVDLAELAEVQRRGPQALLALLQALAAAGDGTLTRSTVAVVTAGAQAVGPAEAPGYAAAALPALVKSARQEIPGLDLRAVDLQGADASFDAAALATELADPAPEPEVAYRQGIRLVGRLENADLLSGPGRELPIEHGGLYLVTGGLGGVGAAVARQLLQTWNARLLIVGRTPLPPREAWAAEALQPGPVGERVRVLRSLESVGGEVRYEVADVTDLAALAGVRRRAEERWNRPLAGVFHLAGVNRDLHWETTEEHRVLRETGAELARVLAPKAQGTWTIYRLLADRPQALVVCMSSVLGEFGAGSYGSYAAASAVQESLVAHRRATTHPRSYCYAWTMWDDLGMSRANPQVVRDATRGRGFHILSVDQALISLLGALYRDQPSLLIGLDSESPEVRRRLRPGGERLVVYYTSRHELEPRLLKELGEGNGAVGRAELRRLEGLPRAPDGAFDRDRLEAAQRPVEAAATRTEREMAGLWAQVLNRPAIRPRDRFFEVGGDSLKATQLLQRVSVAFGVDVSLRDFFDDPTVAGLVGHVEQKRGALATAAMGPTGPVTLDGGSA